MLCPAVARLTSTAPGISDAIRRATAGGVIRSRPPEMTTVGQLKFGMSVTRSKGSVSNSVASVANSRNATAGSSGSPSGTAP